MNFLANPIHSRVYMSVPVSQFIMPNPYPLKPQVCSVHLWFYFCLIHKFIIIFWAKLEGVTQGPAAVPLNVRAKWPFRAMWWEEGLNLVMGRGGEVHQGRDVSDGLTGREGSSEGPGGHMLSGWDKSGSLTASRNGEGSVCARHPESACDVTGTQSSRKAVPSLISDTSKVHDPRKGDSLSYLPSYLIISKSC